MSIEKFNPYDYKSYAELPDDKKDNYKKFNDGFVDKDAAMLFQKAEEKAMEHNQHRPLLKKILNKDEVNAVDLLQDFAQHEFRDKIDNLYDGVLTMSEWDALSKEEFEAMIDKAYEEYIQYQAPIHEASGDKEILSKERVSRVYKNKAERYAQWLEDTIDRPFFAGSEKEVRFTIRHVRELAR